MTAEVDAATRFVHVEFYITAWDDVTGPFFEALVARRRARRHACGCCSTTSGRAGIPGYKEMLAAAGRRPRIEWHPMLPIQPFKGQLRRPDLRNHRKILVVDGGSRSPARRT